MAPRAPGSHDVEWLDVGPPDRDEPGSGSARRRPSRRAVLSVTAISVAVIASVATGVVLSHGERTHRVVASPPATPSAPASTPDALEATATAVPRSGPPTVTSVGHSLLGVTDSWELFARGDNVLIRVQLAAGRVTVTPTPTLGTGGGIALLLTNKAAFTVPSDFVPGYSVADGAQATSLIGGLADGGDVYPGPVDGQFWQQVTSQDRTSAFELVDAAGRDLRRAITLPQTIAGPAMGDGSGYLVVQGVSGSYDARPGSLRRITTGDVTAVGPTAWLAEECDDVGRCSNVIVDKETWQRRVIGPTVVPVALASGVITSDASLAAVARAASNRRFAVNVIDIATGAEHTVADIPDAVFGDQTMVWSPDGRWLFVVGQGGSIEVINSVTLQHSGLGVQLPPVAQLAIRPAG